jgi:hypothetical protein
MRQLIYLLAIAVIALVLLALRTPAGLSARHQVQQRLMCVQHVGDTPNCH